MAEKERSKTRVGRGISTAKRSPYISVLCSAVEKNRLHKEAERLELTLSDYLRLCIFRGGEVKLSAKTKHSDELAKAVVNSEDSNKTLDLKESDLVSFAIPKKPRRTKEVLISVEDRELLYSLAGAMNNLVISLNKHNKKNKTKREEELKAVNEARIVELVETISSDQKELEKILKYLKLKINEPTD